MILNKISWLIESTITLNHQYQIVYDDHQHEL